MFFMSSVIMVFAILILLINLFSERISAAPPIARPGEDLRISSGSTFEYVCYSKPQGPLPNTTSCKEALDLIGNSGKQLLWGHRQDDPDGKHFDVHLPKMYLSCKTSRKGESTWDRCPVD